MRPQARTIDPFNNLRREDTQRQSVAPWLSAHTGSRPSTLPANAVKANVRTAPQQSDGQSVLERKYPGMAQAITLLWGHPEMNAYFERIWMADSSQTPLHPDAMAELMLLARLHQTLKPQRPMTLNQNMYGSQYDLQPKKDVWSDTRPVRRS